MCYNVLSVSVAISLQCDRFLGSGKFYHAMCLVFCCCFCVCVYMYVCRGGGCHLCMKGSSINFQYVIRDNWVWVLFI